MRCQMKSIDSASLCSCLFRISHNLIVSQSQWISKGITSSDNLNYYINMKHINAHSLEPSTIDCSPLPPSVRSWAPPRYHYNMRSVCQHVIWWRWRRPSSRGASRCGYATTARWRCASGRKEPISCCPSDLALSWLTGLHHYNTQILSHYLSFFFLLSFQLLCISNNRIKSLLSSRSDSGLPILLHIQLFQKSTA